MYDILIRNGMVLDGSGSPWFAADVAVAGGRIVAVGRPLGQEASREIDASGKFVTPGFVEEHSHSDVTLLVDGLAHSAVRQGITTMAVGSCGMSAAPLREDLREAYRVAAPCFSFEGYRWTWQSMGEYLDALRSARPSINVVSFVGHAPVRACVMKDPNRPADLDESTRMRAMISEALDQGARGFSTGLNLQTCLFADTTEIAELAKALRGCGLAHHTHMRDYGPALLDSIRQVIEITERAEVPLVISHMYPSGRDHWGQARACLDLVEDARRRGLDVSYDVTPWLRGGASIEQMFPPWVREGGTRATLDRIRDPDGRARLAGDLEHGGDWPGWLRPDWDDWLVCRVGKPQHRQWIGRSIAHIAAQRGQRPAEAALLMFVEDEAQYAVAPQNKCNEDMDVLLAHPLGVPIADGYALRPDGPLAWQDRPNSYGTFPRVLGHYVRERGVLSWEQAIRKMTTVPAQRLGLWERGVIRPGMAADLVVFDPATVASGADYAHPQDYPVGIQWVIVNGAVTVTPDGHTGTAAGEVL